MPNPISWILSVQVKEGRGDDFQSLIHEMVSQTQAGEPGTLLYEFHASADGREYQVMERYANSDATMVHLGNFGQQFMARFFDAVNPMSMVVYGSPSDAVRQGLAGLNPVYLATSAGFAR